MGAVSCDAPNQTLKKAGADHMDEYTIDNVWEEKSEDIKNEIIEFWVGNNALSRDLSETRVNEVFCVGRDADGHISGVGTIYPRFNKQLRNSFYYYRSFVKEDHRRSHLGIALLQFTQQALEEIFVSGDNVRYIGMIIEVSNEVLQKLNFGVWPRTGFVYIGNNAYDQHVRVYYFEGARVS